MHVRVLPFGVLKEALGADTIAVELPGGATVGDLIARLRERAPAVDSRAIAVSINAEYAGRNSVLQDDDEVGLLPPVSGGAPRGAGGSDQGIVAPSNILLTREVIDAARLRCCRQAR